MRARGPGLDRPDLLLQLEHDALGRLLADTRDGLEAGSVLERDRAAQLGGGRAGDDRKRHLRPHPGDGEERLEQLALSRLGKAVELERVLAHVQIGLELDLAAPVGQAVRARRRLDEVADAAHVEDEPVGAPRDRLAAQPGDHPAALSNGGARAWQMATASASAAWFGSGGSASPRIAFTIRCTCAFSARP